MKHRHVLSIVLAGTVLAPSFACAGTGALLYADEFSGATLSHRTSFRPVRVDLETSDHWEPTGGNWYSDAYVHGCDMSDGCELQYYTRYDLNYAVSGPQNYAIPGHQTNFVSSAVDGSLKLMLRAESPAAKGWMPGWMGNAAPNWMADGSNYYAYFNYTSGWIQSVPAFKYGYFEVRAKIPNQGRIVWPAFWLFGGAGYEANRRSIMGENATEIDAFEFTGLTPNVFTHNVHSYHTWSDYYGWYGNPSGTSGNDYTLDSAGNAVTLHKPYMQPLSGVDLGQYHTYAVEWAPRKLTFYMDGQPMGSPVTKDVPSNFMRIIVNMALPEWLTGWSSSDIPQNTPFEIDYVRAYALDKKDFVPEWTNGGSDRINWFIQNPDDRYVVGNFDGDTAKELLAINPNTGYAHLMDYARAQKTDVNGYNWKYLTPTWSTAWSTGADKINWFYLNANDRYLAGNFIAETSGPVKDELLAINADTKYAHLMTYQSGTWSTPWSTGSGQLNWWYFSVDDKYVVADFDGDGRDELLAINTRTKYAHLMKYSGTGWTTNWSTGSGQINWWYMNASDQYVTGDFDGDGRDELLAVNASTKYAHLMKYFGGVWSTPWSTGSGQIDWWYMNAGDQYEAADFDGDGRNELLANNNATGYTHMMSFGAGATTVTTTWTNEGLGQTHKPDFVVAGDFDQDGAAELLFVSQKDWAFLSKYKIPGESLTF